METDEVDAVLQTHVDFRYLKSLYLSPVVHNLDRVLTEYMWAKPLTDVDGNSENSGDNQRAQLLILPDKLNMAYRA